ncbi:hypothetical protein [Streptomyces sp. NBC_01264]|uniref:hypothetical protein n=1 Tax=Streptomyces sp. NBC_01264 TaxID=2903804 RepID=UPI002253F862|nr:hypothetical protein [Streptomyces sp. NBC_01264]MCX4775596.1 hypothetical protein [Streptomyces sp. NBC_01264]
MRTGFVRAAAGLGVLVVLTVAGWLVWVLPGPQLGAVLGVGPVDGVVVVQECHEATDEEGYATGTDCTGHYTPRRAGEPARAMLLDTAAEEYRPGSAVPVRTARGRAYEFSGLAVFNYGTATGLLLVPFLTLTAYLAACVRRRNGHPPEPDGYLFAGLAGLVVVIVLGAGIGFLVSIGRAIL